MQNETDFNRILDYLGFYGIEEIHRISVVDLTGSKKSLKRDRSIEPWTDQIDNETKVH